jgi:glucose/arabinose dehydrogenase
MNTDGSAFEVFAEGIRNTVGFAWHPGTKELWFTDNGRDWLGDDAPKDELNRAFEQGMHFGYPFCHAGEVLDPEFGEGRTCSDFQPPVQKLGAHVAALGMLFYTGNMFPAKYREGAWICEHGSWNRSTPSGYQLSFVELDGNRAISYKPLVEGFLQDEKPWARPVAFLQMPDGSVLFSDDLGGRVFRLSYSAPE